jgi:hydroxymethylbilane synthase
LRLGSRGSALALAQAEAVAAALRGAEVIAVKTDDDAVGDKSRFVRGVERALLDGDVDLGVHSAKDLPGELPDGLGLVGVLGREDPRDALVGAGGLAELAEGARVGTSSLRRRSQLLALRPDLEVAELRGNVDTRLRRVADGDFDAIVLASAGLARLGRAGEIGYPFELIEMTPSAGQGSLALEARDDDAEAGAAAGRISDRAALTELAAERAAIAVLDADCDSAVGICARHDADALVVHGYAGAPDGGDWVRDRVEGDHDQPVSLGEALAERMLAAGAQAILEAGHAAGR